MKTAMQELYDWVEQRDFYISKEWLNSLLEKEKQQIIEAYDEGREIEYQYHINCDPVNYSDVRTSEQYYNNTFKTV